jgi:hypothetical protein
MKSDENEKMAVLSATLKESCEKYSRQRLEYLAKKHRLLRFLNQQ